MKNKKGFTLIELLAVVVVLAVVALISIPVILNVIENVKKGAIKNSAYGMLESADVYYAQHIDKLKEPIEFEINNGVQVGTEKLSYTGKVDMGYLMLFKNNDKAVCVDDGKYSASKGVNDKKVTVIEGKCTGEYDEETKSYIVSQTSSGFTSISIKSYSSASQLPGSGNTNDIAIISDTKVTGYYISGVAPTPSEGMVWVVESPRSTYYLESKNVRIGVSYAMQYEEGKWNLKHAYVYNDGWKLLYYVDMLDGEINLENSNLGDIEITKNYEYTGKYQEFTATFSGYYNIQLWGAQGGSYNATYYGGKGAYTYGDIYLNAGDTIYIYVGGAGTVSSKSINGGWNGGGQAVYHTSTDVGSSGGGATDIRLKRISKDDEWNEFESLKSRIMVAAGGGGSYYWGGNGSSEVGGAGGTLNGESGFYGNSTILEPYYHNIAQGGTQSKGGTGVQDNATLARVSTNGGFGYGGNGASKYQGSGGGGGYYGGGGSTYTGSYQTSAAGGSSYISGYEGCSSITKESSSVKIIHNGSSYHYSNYYFKNSIMKTGINEGNGKAIISLKTIEVDNPSPKIQKYNYYYSGDYQEFIVPKTGYYKVNLNGGQGGSYNRTYYGGKGATTSGQIYLTSGEKIYIYVGSAGKVSNSSTKKELGGYNGGGSAIYHSANDVGSSGGGATDIRLINGAWNDFDSLKTRIMVAAGGGGSYYWGGNGSSEIGGSGGALRGEDGFYGTSHISSNFAQTFATGGTQVLSGMGVQDIYTTSRVSSNGTFGSGGNGDIVNQGSGGGSGWYGGGGSTYTGTNQTSAAGGSSYISGYNGVSSIAKSSTKDNIIHTGDIYHYSNYYFINSSMTANSNIGNGYAIIEYTENTTKIEKVISQEYNYPYSGTYQIFNVPKNGYYKMELWGAQGGSYNSNYYGGKGAYTKGEIYLNKGTKLYIYVGQKGSLSYENNKFLLNSWNGGGRGVFYTSTDTGASGGGATDIRTVNSNLTLWNEFESLKSRIIVAAGGGGSYYWGGSRVSEYGGSGGGLYANPGYYGTSRNTIGLATGGTQISAGKGVQDSAIHSRKANDGAFGYGGNGDDANQGSGGGSGWYGGGGSTYTGTYQTSAAGGSSYISGHAGCIAVTSSGNPKVTTYSTLSDSVSYTGYKFNNTIMIDGDGYNWTTIIGASGSGMPSPTDSSIQMGNTGDGYAKITYLGE